MPKPISTLYSGNKFVAADFAPNFQMIFRDPAGATPADETGASDLTEFFKAFFSDGWGITIQSVSLTSAIPAQAFGPRIVPYNMTLTACEMVAVPITGQTTGDIVIDVWSDTYANYPPVVGDSIVGAGTKPTISGALKSLDSSLADYTRVDLVKGEWAKFNVVSCTNLHAVAIKFSTVRTA